MCLRLHLLYSDRLLKFNKLDKSFNYSYISPVAKVGKINSNFFNFNILNNFYMNIKMLKIGAPLFNYLGVNLGNIISFNYDYIFNNSFELAKSFNFSNSYIYLKIMYFYKIVKKNYKFVCKKSRIKNSKNLISVTILKRFCNFKIKQIPYQGNNALQYLHTFGVVTSSHLNCASLKALCPTGQYVYKKLLFKRLLFNLQGVIVARILNYNLRGRFTIQYYSSTVGVNKGDNLYIFDSSYRYILDEKHFLSLWNYRRNARYNIFKRSKKFFREVFVIQPKIGGLLHVI